MNPLHCHSAAANARGSEKQTALSVVQHVKPGEEAGADPEHVAGIT